jgi:CelD/BcsL family acetyltransferase involved in cellulose biosynthesis
MTFLARMHARAYDCAAVTDPADFLRLQPEWDALWAAAPNSYVGESFEWAQLCWSLAPTGPGRLLCVTVRQDRRLVAVWPLLVSRKGPLRLASPLAASSEYCPFLVHPEADAEAVWLAIAGLLARERRVDALRLVNVRHDTAPGQCLSRSQPSAATLYETPTRFVSADELADWKAFRGRLSRKTRETLGYRRRRFCEAATVTFREATQPDERAAAWEWLLEKKRRWAKQRGIDSPWLFAKRFDRFTRAALDVLGARGARRMFILEADGAIAAAALVSVDQARVEGFILGYDEAFSAFSPGRLLSEDCLRWASERGLGFDLRLGDDMHKQEWPSNAALTTTYAVPLTAAGHVLIAGLRLVHTLRRNRERKSPERERETVAATA